MTVPTVLEVDDFKVDIDDGEAIVNGFSSVATRLGGTKQSLSQLLSNVTHGTITVYNPSTTYTTIDQWVSYVDTASSPNTTVVYRPIPSALPIAPVSPLDVTPDVNKWVVAAGDKYGDVKTYVVNNYAQLRVDLTTIPDNSLVFVINPPGPPLIVNTNLASPNPKVDDGGIIIVSALDTNKYAERPVDTFVSCVWFETVGDGIADDTTALENFIIALGSGFYESTIIGKRIGWVPAGKYKTIRPLTQTALTAIKGVRNCSVIQPTSAVTTFAWTQLAASLLEDIVLDGINAISGCNGLDIGGASLINEGATNGVTIARFDVTNDVGLNIGETVDWSFNQCSVRDNYNGIKLLNTGAETPTICSFNDLICKSNDNRGLWIASGKGHSFNGNCNFELNGVEGVYVHNAGIETILDIGFNNIYIEANQQSVAIGAARHATYQTFINGASRNRIRDSHFFLNSNEAKAVRYNDSTDCVHDNSSPVGIGINLDAILVEGNSRVYFPNWPTGAASTEWSEIIEDTTPNTFGAMLIGAETSTWPTTPTITFATPGDLIVAFSTQTGRYTINGNLATLHFNLVTSTFTHTTASGALKIENIPFFSANYTAVISIGSLEWSGINKSGFTQVYPQIQTNTDTMDIVASGMGVTLAAVNAADMPSAGTVFLSGTITYEIQGNQRS